MTSILVHYSELALKGKNRPWFIHRLVRNLHAALAGLHVKEIRTPIGRIEVVLGQESTMAEIRVRLSRVFGVANYSPAIHVPLDFAGMAEAIVSQLPPKESARTFRVHVRRSDPKFATPSPELARDLGSKVWHARGWVAVSGVRTSQRRGPSAYRIDLTIRRRASVIRCHRFECGGS